MKERFKLWLRKRLQVFLELDELANLVFEAERNIENGYVRIDTNHNTAVNRIHVLDQQVKAQADEIKVLRQQVSALATSSMFRENDVKDIKRTYSEAFANVDNRLKDMEKLRQTMLRIAIEQQERVG